MQTTRKIITTTATTYANGDIHLGHIIEAIQADIWHRFHKQQGHESYFFSGSDAHGTPIMLSAQKQNISPEELVTKMHADHEMVYKNFLVGFDNFYTSHSEENKEFSELFYQRLKARGDITSKMITQAFDPSEKIFLSDRYIKGECPSCHAKDQYGDNCENCGATYSPMNLINPISAISGATPIAKESEHFFFELNHYNAMLQEWIESKALQPQIRNKLKEWFVEGLQPWDISRDAPYFGFEIPGEPGKYFYVWLDAPIGYIASTKNFADRVGKDNNEFWRVDSPFELYHFIGKDIVYFHALFWPAMLKGADFRRPTSVFAHGFLTINGAKMSKSRGTFITGKDYLAKFPAEYLRYYFAAKLNSEVEDIDLNFKDFMLRVNSDLVGKFVNLASRSAGFITKKFNGRMSTSLAEPKLFNDFVEKGTEIAACYEARDYNRAVREIMGLADRANQYIDQQKPWALAKEAGREQEVQDVCSFGLNLFKILSGYLKPILPETAVKIEEFLNIEPITWDSIATPLLDHTINPFQPLMQRVSEEQIAEFLK